MKIVLKINPTELREALEKYCLDRTGHELDSAMIVSAYNEERVFIVVTPVIFETFEVVKHRLTE